MSSLIEENINKLIRECIDTILGIPMYSIRANQDAPRPKTAYASVSISSFANVSLEETEYSDNEDGTITETIRSPRNLLVSINTYRELAKDRASAIRIGMMRSSILEKLNASNVGLGNRSEVISIPEDLGTGWEERANLTITLNIVDEDSDSINSIESVGIQGEYQSNSNITNLSIEV